MSRVHLLLCALVFACCSPSGSVDKDGGQTTGGDDASDDTNDINECARSGAPKWQVLSKCRAQGELLSVTGTGPNDVWAVGNQGQVLHFDGCEWKEMDSGVSTELWWVHAFDDGTVYISGSAGTILRYTEETGFKAMDSGVKVTLFGIWGSAPDDMWSIGFSKDDAHPGAILRYDGKAWSAVTNLPKDMPQNPHYFKVWGSASDDVWVVGSQDLILHWDGKEWQSTPSGQDQDWVTVTGRVKPDGTSDVIVAGGTWQAAILQRTKTGWVDVSPDDFPGLQGVCMQPDGSALATGVNGTLLTGTLSPPWNEALGAPEDLPGCGTIIPDYHACYADGTGGFFAVGGNFLGGLKDGALIYYGPPIPTQGL